MPRNSGTTDIPLDEGMMIDGTYLTLMSWAGPHPLGSRLGADVSLGGSNVRFLTVHVEAANYVSESASASTAGGNGTYDELKQITTGGRRMRRRRRLWMPDGNDGQHGLAGP
jgi:hypothetical protein